MYSVLTNDRVIVTDEHAHNLYNKRYYGNLTETGLELSFIEALFLLTRAKIEIFDKKENQVTIEDLTNIVREKHIFSHYLVYKDLRIRGYIIKTGFKYGSDFRIYERGHAPGDGHSNFLVKILSEEQSIKVRDFSSYVRVAHGVRKTLLLAVVDDEYDITYYNIEWTRP
ncbi:tRNA-intron lyase [Methanosphaera sp. WGK6]|uniref:tRNA-intron lyase n=1 Tax=Methanosphaera sp. WGK6 TaxID=1561964 RepID=UPI00084C55C2|nr:tRNA-intron lyase [Methanosphaera sp. WGK6]OED29676.1 ribonuclease BN [Methanosphaera sp. WGK6]